MVAPYILHKYKVQATCHLDKEVLHELGFSIYSAEAIDEDGKTYVFTLLPMEIRQLHRYGLIQHHGHQTGIDKFFGLKPCGIDVQKVLQMLKTMQEDGHCIVQNDQGRDVPLQINARLISEALHLSREGRDLTRWTKKHEKEFTFKLRLGQELTYGDLKDPNLEPTLRLINQYIVLAKPTASLNHTREYQWDYSWLSTESSQPY